MGRRLITSSGRMIRCRSLTSVSLRTAPIPSIHCPGHQGNRSRLRAQPGRSPLQPHVRKQRLRQSGSHRGWTENRANYRYSINGTQPRLNILWPTTNNKARVSDHASPDRFIVQVELVDSDGVPLSGVDLNSFSFQVVRRTLAMTISPPATLSSGSNGLIYGHLCRIILPLTSMICMPNTAHSAVNNSRPFGIPDVKTLTTCSSSTTLQYGRLGKMEAADIPLACSLIVAAPVTRSASSASTT